MAVRIQANGDYNLGVDAKTEQGYMCAIYNGSLGGGTLEFFTTIDTYRTAIPNSKLTALKVDDNGQAIKMISFSAAGALSCTLSGATAPDFYVAQK